ncbi:MULTISPECIES: hypothetical protein [Mycobacterium]|uniref:Facilitated glucose transporter n=1 Tax=Mycobacterium kiyosense TaxID=2871094 RepID=A0A9P3Q2M4_9MYCO|nr:MULTISPECIES: hypothetical protein [Mycobacterium]BDB44454.1 hypothetical protein IWGMT90018_49000 [Mycobacterium kiyosense]BDE15970.1 hypothetical protein MKCMC460_48300 [Mycobacterium sp. 20KCMC460]GLB81804.1 hypothetical protein SRL2020028_10600 [Mycobacterium kiyosense]GLB90332.1 hypothetical protein SRL2020130_31490 [Mycobacterium kiyosense]GLB96079.1 hypothetical protein SRL2020226_28550 [Mycobacterium kiyosense]
MGTGVDRLAARQRPNLTETKPRAVSAEETSATDPAIRAVVLTLLAVDGVLSALAGAMLLPSYIGSVPFPVSALVSGLVNAALVWAGSKWTTSPRVAALPLWTWLSTVAGLSLGGPGGDIVLGGQGVMAYGALLLIVCGVVPPVWVLWRSRTRS